MFLMVATLLLLSVAGMIHVVCRRCGVDEDRVVSVCGMLDRSVHYVTFYCCLWVVFAGGCEVSSGKFVMRC